MEINEKLTMYQGVKKAAKGNKTTAVYYQGRKISYKQFIKKVDAMADIMQNRFNVKQGDCVLLAQPNRGLNLFLCS